MTQYHIEILNVSNDIIYDEDITLDTPEEATAYAKHLLSLSKEPDIPVWLRGVAYSIQTADEL